MLGLLPQSIMDESDVDPDLPGLIPSPHKPSVDMNNPRSLDDETCVVHII